MYQAIAEWFGDVRNYVWIQNNINTGYSVYSCDLSSANGMQHQLILCKEEGKSILSAFVPIRFKDLHTYWFLLYSIYLHLVLHSMLRLCTCQNTWWYWYWTAKLCLDAGWGVGVHFSGGSYYLFEIWFRSRIQLGPMWLVVRLT